MIDIESQEKSHNEIKRTSRAGIINYGGNLLGCGGKYS